MCSSFFHFEGARSYLMDQKGLQLCSSQIEQQEKQERIVPEWSRHWTLILDKKWDNHFFAISDHFWKKIFFGQKLCCPPPSPHSTYQRRGSWCQKTNHGANHGANMVPTMVPWCQPIFSPYQIISGRKYFLVKKFPPSPPPVPLWHKDRGDGGDGGERGGWSLVIVSEKWSEQVSRQGGRSCAGARVAPAEKFGLGRKF